MIMIKCQMCEYLDNCWGSCKKPDVPSYTERDVQIFERFKDHQMRLFHLGYVNILKENSKIGELEGLYGATYS